MPLNLYARIPKGLMMVVVGGCVFMPSGKVGTDTWMTVLPSDWDSPLVLYLCNPILCEWEWNEVKAFAILVLLLAIWNNIGAKPNVLSEGGNANLLISVFQVYLIQTISFEKECLRTASYWYFKICGTWQPANWSLFNYKSWCDKMFRKVPGYNGQNIMAACSPCLHITLVFWMEIY